MRLVVAVLSAALAVSACSGDSDGSDRSGEPTQSSPTESGAASSQLPTTATPTEESSAMPTIDQGELDRRLIAAAWRNDVPMARRLIAAGADVNAKDATEQSAYLISTSEGYYELLDLTLRHGADLQSLDSFDGTGLIRAAERGHARIVGRLIQEGIDVDQVNNLGWTALHEAIILGDGSPRYVDTIRVLVAGKANLVTRSERDGKLPMEHARERDQTQVLATLEAARDDVWRTVKRPDAALLRAAVAGDADNAALMVRRDADLEARDDNRRTPLLLAAIEDNVEVARLLVWLGADPDAQDYRQDSAWLVTGVTGSVEMLEALLPANPDLTLRNRFGGISVIPASERGHVAYVRRVVQTGIDVNHLNDLGWTALLEAVILGDGSARYQEIVRILLDAGADPRVADRDGVTALAHAESRGHDEIARILRRAG